MVLFDSLLFLLEKLYTIAQEFGSVEAFYGCVVVIEFPEIEQRVIARTTMELMVGCVYALLEGSRCHASGMEYEGR